MGSSGSTQKSLAQADEGRPYFSCALQIGESEEPLLPILKDGRELPKLLQLHYVAVDGAEFSIKCSLARPAPEGLAYGARVYVDGATDDDGKAVADHFFWFGPGETQYVVRGFFAGNDSSFRFRFGAPRAKGSEPSSKRPRLDGTQTVGCIRVQFCKVSRWVTRKGGAKTSEKPAVAAAGGRKERASNVAAVPGPKSADDGLAALEREAVLSSDVLCEVRTIFNDFAGFRALVGGGGAHVRAAMQSPETFQGCPLAVLAAPDVRRRAIDCFLRAIQDGLLEHESSRRVLGVELGARAPPAPEAPRGGDDDDDAEPDPNSAVAIADLARAICRTLSPAGSRLVCAGDKDPPLGRARTHLIEGAVQRIDAPEAERLADFDLKTAGLLDHFSSLPDLYEVLSLEAASKSWLPSIMVGGAAASAGEYAVKHAVTTIE